MTTELELQMSSRRGKVRTLLTFLIAAGVAGAASVACSELQLEDESKKPTFTSAMGENTVILCSDGVDNDGDGFTDCDDEQCTYAGNPDGTGCETESCPGKVVCVTTENTDLLCIDGIDNDGNGFIDCGDFSCTQNSSVCCTPTAEEEAGNDGCSDGIDNDCDGFVDCGDFSCLDAAVCCDPTGREDNDDACSDGIDNDCNGYADCEDFGCSQGMNVTVCGVVETAPEDTEANCSDGLDNDRDGHVDCADWECDPKDGESPFAYCRDKGSEDTEATCSDGIDNDRDGITDCQDWSCFSNVPSVCGG